MDRTPLITVIIPTINEGPTLAVAIESIVKQTYKNLEIIVIDDWSTDDTREIVRGFETKDNRVKYVKCPYDDPKRLDCRGVNISVGYLARNYAMDISHGEWVTFQDADDASLLNRIETQYRLAKRYDAICATVSSFRFTESYLDKKLDVEAVFKNEKDIVVSPDKIAAQAKRCKGILMNDWFPHSKVPFVFKKRAPTRKLFLASTESYFGTDAAPLFRRETIKTVRFRKREDRVWPAQSGRGVGRDHIFHLAETYGRCYSFKLPLYLWRVRSPLKGFEGWDKYLID